MEKTSPKNGKVLSLLFAGVLMGALDISIVGPAIPSIEKALFVSGRSLSWVFSIYVLFNLVGIPLMSKLSDLFGRRKVYVWSVGLFGLGSVIVSFTEYFPILLIGRAIQGFGASGIFPVASAIIGDIYPPEKRGRKLGMLGAVFGIAFMLGPPIAGIILKYFDWNFLFSINLPIALIIMVFANNLLPAKPILKRTEFDVPGVLLLGLFLASFTLGINFLNSNQLFSSLRSFEVWPFLAASLLFGYLLFKTELKVNNPIIRISYFSNRQILLVGGMAIGLGLFQSSFIFVPKMLVNLFAVQPFTASFMLIPIVLLSALGSPISGRLTDSFGSKYVILWGLVAASAGMFMVAIIPADKALFYVAGSLIGLGFSMRTALNYIMLNEVGAAERATSQGLLTIFISLGQLTGAALIGAMIATDPQGISGFRHAFFILGGISAVLAFLSLWLKNRSKELAGQSA